MTTSLDDIRLADDYTLRVVWKFGGYEIARGPYPGRRRALFVIFARGTRLPAADPEPQVPAHIAVCALSAAWSLAIVATGRIPGRPRRIDLASAPRGCRSIRRHPFRSAVHCTAPPARRIRPGRPM
jgi:hypothetical protein